MSLLRVDLMDFEISFTGLKVHRAGLLVSNVSRTCTCAALLVEILILWTVEMFRI
jgi:hypothetical protein